LTLAEWLPSSPMALTRFQKGESMRSGNKVMVWAVLLCALLMAAPAFGAPFMIWEEHSFDNNAAGAAGNVYYGGGVFDDTFYTGQIQYGPEQWGTAQVNGTALVNKADVGTVLAKSATLLNGYLYCGGMVTGGIYRMSNWDPSTVVNLGYSYAESLVTDGNYLYSNDSSTKNRIHKFKINEDGSVGEVWTISIGGANNRFRGLSYCNGKLYTAEHNAESKDPAGDRGIYEIDAETGQATQIATVPSTGAANAYQVVRYGNRLYLAGLDDMLRVYEYNGSAWNLISSDNLGLGDLYGIGVRGDGTKATNFWVTSVNRNISYWILDINDAPEVSVGDAKNLPSGSLVSLKDVAVTALTSDGFFAEAKNRSSGVRVKWTTPLSEAGVAADIIGVTGTDGPEKIVKAVSVNTGAGYTAVPVSMSGHAAGGNLATGGKGLENSSMLVSTWGEVTGVDYLTNCFYVDDGSGVLNDTPTTFITQAVPGMKVQSTGDLPMQGAFLKVTGILRLQTAADKIIPRLDIRDGNDVTPIYP